MRVLIVDDHPLYREGLNALLAGLDPGIETLHAGTVEQAIDIGREHAVDLVLLDLQMPGTQDLQALERVKPAFDSASVVVISANEDAELIRGAIDRGASGYIPKRTDPAVTIAALRTVLASGIYLPAELLEEQFTLAATAAATARGDGQTTIRDILSPRQVSVLQRLLQGKSNKVIAEELRIAEGTVKAHLSAVYLAIGVNTRAQAMYRAHELGLLGVEWPTSIIDESPTDDRELRL